MTGKRRTTSDGHLCGLCGMHATALVHNATANGHTLAPDAASCCETHDGPHVHGCVRSRVGGEEHRGICVTVDRRVTVSTAAGMAR